MARSSRGAHFIYIICYLRPVSTGRSSVFGFKMASTMVADIDWLVGWMVFGAPTFVIWHHSLIHSSDLAPLINSQLVLVSSKCKLRIFHRLHEIRGIIVPI